MKLKLADDANINYLLWSEIVPNPRDIDIEKGAAFAKDQKIDYLIAIGGGSSMDTAKALGIDTKNMSMSEAANADETFDNPVLMDASDFKNLFENLYNYEK